MNKLVLLGGALSLSSLAPPAYKTYHNQRFGYHLDYPADFRPQPEPETATAVFFSRPMGRRCSPFSRAMRPPPTAWPSAKK